MDKPNHAMTDRQLELYPQFCFHLSPTVNAWVPLLSTDIFALTTVPGFATQNLYFYLNHPLKWVRICGLVVAIDDYAERQLLTIDDSSGETIKCLLLKEPGSSDPSDGTLSTQPSTIIPKPSNLRPGEEISVGNILDIKGIIVEYRERQIKAKRLFILRSTEQEVEFWKKRNAFWLEILVKPWILNKRILKKCWRKEQREAILQHRKKTDREKQKRLRELGGKADMGTKEYSKISHQKPKKERRGYESEEVAPRRRKGFALANLGDKTKQSEMRARPELGLKQDAVSQIETTKHHTIEARLAHESSRDRVRLFNFISTCDPQDVEVPLRANMEQSTPAELQFSTKEERSHGRQMSWAAWASADMGSIKAGEQYVTQPVNGGSSNSGEKQRKAASCSLAKAVGHKVKDNWGSHRANLGPVHKMCTSKGPNDKHSTRKHGSLIPPMLQMEDTGEVLKDPIAKARQVKRSTKREITRADLGNLSSKKKYKQHNQDILEKRTKMTRADMGKS